MDALGVLHKVRLSFTEAFTPKLISVLREGYRFKHLRADLIAGLTVAIVALPLSMAIAMASGATPAQGLTTAIVGGALVSLFSGSRVQIGGPAGAFIVLVAGTVAQHGMDGLILATFLSGILLALAGLFRLGTFVKFIPFPVTIGFLSGIAVIIFASQLTDLFGLNVPDEPADLGPKLQSIWHAKATFTPAAAALSLAVVVAIFTLRRYRPKWPGMLLAITTAAIITSLFSLPVDTIGSVFGGIPSSLPPPRLPTITVERVVTLMPVALSFALLGAIESLLSAVIADGMTGRRHRSNCELLGQGIANVGASLFGGFCVTGTIARTSTNVRAGAHGPFAGVFHSLFLLLFVLFLAPLAAHIPLSALAAVLVVVSWDMIDFGSIRGIYRSWGGEIIVGTVTFLLTVFVGLSEAIVTGVAMGSLLFIYRMGQQVGRHLSAPLVAYDTKDRYTSYDEARRRAASSEVLLYRPTGALFFASSWALDAILKRIQGHPKAVVFDLSGVPFMDTSGAHLLDELALQLHRKDVGLYFVCPNPAVLKPLKRMNLDRIGGQIVDSVDDAFEALGISAPTDFKPDPEAAT